MLGHRTASSSNNVWMKPSEQFDKTATKRRWKGFSGFMFWGSFSYSYKGPCYCWKKGTAAAKKAAPKVMNKLSKERKDAARDEWESKQGQDDMEGEARSVTSLILVDLAKDSTAWKRKVARAFLHIMSDYALSQLDFAESDSDSDGESH